MKKETILICVPHIDDEALMAGTILKYKQENKQLIKIVFSKGEKSHPHLKPEIIAKERKQESIKVDHLLHIKRTIFFDLTDAKVSTEIENIKPKLIKLIKKYKPKQIFIPTHIDPHPDHRAVNKTILELVDQLKSKTEVYAFEVWNISKQQLPKLYIDITPYFHQKIKIMKKFKSQWFFMYLLIIPVYLRARSYGKKIDAKYAERFYKLR